MIDPIRLLQHVHGHVGWLAAAVLVHPAIVLRRKKKADWAVGSAVGLATIAGGMGAWLYPSYRERLKQGIFQEAPAIGYLFERKEHLAFAAVALAWVGGLAYVVARTTDESPTRDSLRKASQVSFTIAAALAIVVAALGTTIAAFRSF
ncbi:MAG TPA: hypothetical protein VF407_13505 [Polyangiaceae bacterium]